MKIKWLSTEGGYSKKTFCMPLAHLFLEAGQNTGLIAQKNFVQ